MKIHFLFWGIFSVGVLGCALQHQFEHSSCSFLSNFTDQSCSGFVFVSCQYEECLALDKSGECVLTNASVDSWRECTRRCCDPFSLYLQQYSSLQLCQQYIDGGRKGDSQGKWQIGLVIGLVGLVSVILCYCGWRCKCVQSQGEPNKNNDSTINIVDQKQIKRNWREAERTGEQCRICPICLGDNPQGSLKCEHFMHPLCLLSWVRRKRECPVCRSSNVSSVEMYCEVCWEQKFEVILEGVSGVKGVIVCDRCGGVDQDK